jgi:tetratricopeptide (TPR) repeat protein
VKRGRTILISASGLLPGNIGYAQALWYEPDTAGRLTGQPAVRFRDSLQAAIRQSQRATICDSPVYEFFPDLQVILPPELEAEHIPRRAAPARKQQAFAQSFVESPELAMGYLRQSEAVMRGAPDTDPVEYLNLLRKYRDVSEWDRVVALASDAPPAIASSPEVQQVLALALNRRGAEGDQQRAIDLMEKLVAETGGDGEAFGVLGRIYKDRYAQAKRQADAHGAAENLDHALQHYRAGFEKNPKDYYPGINVVLLLLDRNDDAARAELEAIVPRVRAAVQERREAGSPNFWDLATELQLAAVARDWACAEEAGLMAVTAAPSAWMLETTLRDLRRLGEQLPEAGDRARLEEICGVLQRAGDAANVAAERAG